MALTLWTGNEVYLYLTVAFIQVRVIPCVTIPPALMPHSAARFGPGSVKRRRGALARCTQPSCTNSCPHVNLIRDIPTAAFPTLLSSAHNTALASRLIVSVVCARVCAATGAP